MNSRSRAEPTDSMVTVDTQMVSKHLCCIYRSLESLATCWGGNKS